MHIEKVIQNKSLNSENNNSLILDSGKNKINFSSTINKINHKKQSNKIEETFPKYKEKKEVSI